MSQKGPFIVLKVVASLILIALLIDGGFMVYKTGYAQGVAQAPAVAKAIQQAAENGQGAPVPPMYAYGYHYGPDFYGHHGFGFFPLGGICGSLLFLFLILGLFRMIFFRPWHGGWKGHHMHGPWGRHWENGVPPMFEEWHKRAHGEADSSDGQSAKADA